MENKTAVFGGGCFWCVEAVFQMLEGVNAVNPGYAGGHTKNPTYESTSRGDTGHAEVIEIEYSPEKLSYEDLLTVFFASHDPTTLNRQGADVGTQYRSIILYQTKEEKEKAEKMIEEINTSDEAGDPVVTEVKELETFYPAEEYHKDYFEKNPSNPYCLVVINPKLDKVKAKFQGLLKENKEK